MKVLDLFSGIGGFSLGLERAGMETVAFCENDIHCQKVLKKHWPLVPIIDDVKRLNTKTLDIYLENNEFWQNIDLICGGFPCQDISTGNTKGRGISGSRSGLWKEYYRLIKEVKPRYVIIENVANLRSKGLGQVLKDIGTLGYNCEWNILSAYSIGSPHLRERIYICAWREDLSDPNAFRFWGTATKKKKDSKGVWKGYGWPERSASFRDVFRKIPGIKPVICRGIDGVSRKLDKDRQERIRQLGNSVLPQIPELIGKAILDHEKMLTIESNDESNK